jgi:hypothetical protein
MGHFGCFPEFPSALILLALDIPAPFSPNKIQGLPYRNPMAVAIGADAPLYF